MGIEMKSQVEAAAARVTGVGLDPAMIITIITTLLPILLSCFKREEEPSPARAQAAIRDAYAKNPEKLRRRLRAQVHRHSPEPLDKGQELAIADAIIAQAMDAPPKAVSAIFAEGGI
jgi:hypothetical protein